jgi:WD40 repeat protein
MSIALLLNFHLYLCTNLCTSCEGGARSLSVFDNQVGSGSVSPLIVTGGKDGDVGLHDFRYIVTGKAKRHKRSDSIGQSSPTSLNHDKDHNVDGMLWYIPKAHSGKESLSAFVVMFYCLSNNLHNFMILGSVTKIATIPNTSLFLTGSTDGDVKLWDVASSKLIHHWSKIHEKHTFLQSGSRGFGGVVRVNVSVACMSK